MPDDRPDEPERDDGNNDEGLNVGPKRYRHEIMKDDNSGQATLRGDHIGLLSFNWLGDKLKAKVRYWSIDGKSKPSRTVTLF